MVFESWENQLKECLDCGTSKKINISYEDKIETLIEMFGWVGEKIMKDNLTKQEIQELQELLCSWEDDNITDYEYCNKVGDILELGNWTWKGSK